MEHGQTRIEQWGHTRVEVIGRVPHDRIGWLYGQFDVLVAPSFWPESFGLVTREAIAYHRWVVASNRGAMAKDVTPDGNGFVVDVSRPDALAEVLTRIDDNPDRFRLPTPGTVELRRTEDQVAEIISALQDILPPQPVSMASVSVRKSRTRGKVQPPRRPVHHV
jgi:glycosyltransferase involved in cell wall biosynthesis